MKDSINKETDSQCAESYNKDISGIASGAGINFIGKIFGAVLQYIHLIAISKILGVKVLGGVLLGLTLINITGLISRLGLDLSVIKFVAQYIGTKDHARIKGVVTTALITSALSGLIMALLLYFGADTLWIVFKEKEGFKEVIQTLGWTLPVTSIMLVALAATQGAKIMKYTTYAYNLTLPLLNLLGVLALYILGFKLSGVMGSFVFATIIATLLALFFMLKTFPKARTSTPIFENRTLFSVSLPLALVLFLSFILLWTDTIMLGYFKSSTEVGVYNTAMKTALLTSMILTSFNTMFAPVISDLHNRADLKRLEALFKIVARWIFMVSLPVFFIMTLLASEIMTVFGADFTSGNRPLAILTFGQLINASVGTVGLMLALSGRQKMVMYNSVLICLINFLLNYYLIPQYGITGAALASAIAMGLVNIVMVIEVYICLKMHPFSANFIKPIVYASSLFITCWTIKTVVPEQHYALQLLLYPLLFLSLYSFAIYKWGLAKEDELILDMIKSKIPQGA